MKNVKKEIWPIFFLLLISFLMWRQIPSLQFQGEGFYYFAKVIPDYNFSKFINDITSFPLTYDTFAKILFNILSPRFSDQTNLYMWFLFWVMIAVDGLFYLFIRVSTNSKLAAFLSALLFSTSFVGKFDMYANGGYQYFAQRAIVLLPQIGALIFLSLYLKKINLIFYLISLGLYLLGIMMGFFGTWFLAPFIFYPIFYLLFHFKEGDNIFIKTFWTPLPYIVGNFLLVKDNVYSFPEQSILYLLLHRNDFVIQGITQQLAVITLPIGWYRLLTETLSKFLSSYTLETISGETVNFLTIGVLLLVLYIGATIVIWKKSPAFLLLTFTAFFSAVSMLFFNLYLNTNTVLTSLESSRYFYFPSIFLFTFWGIFLAVIFRQRRFLKILVIIFCFIWLIHNYISIQKNLAFHRWRHQANEDTIKFLRSWQAKLKTTPAYIYLPATFSAYGGEFVKLFYNHPQGIVNIESLNPINVNELAEKRVNPDKVYVLHYDNDSGKIIDQTQYYRQLLQELKNRL